VSGSRARRQQQLAGSLADVDAGSALADQQAVGNLYLFFKDPHSLWYPARVGQHEG
jgi:hypothetical protein